MNLNLKISIGVLAVLLVVAGTFLFTQRASGSNNLTTLGPADAMAYRYEAMARYYDGLQSSLAPQTQNYPWFNETGVDLTTLSYEDEDAFYYKAMDYFFLTHPDYR